MKEEKGTKILDQSGKDPDVGTKILKQPGVQIDRGDTGRVATSRVERDYGPGPREGVRHPGRVEIGTPAENIKPGSDPDATQADSRSGKPKVND